MLFRLPFANPAVQMVIANGATAGRYLGKFRQDWRSQANVLILPSTSPANARTTFAEKLSAWAVMLEVINSS